MALPFTRGGVVRIVVIGGGFAGTYCAQALERRISSSDAEIVLLDRKNFVSFTPLLVEAGTGALEPRHAVVPIRSCLRRTRFCMVDVEGIDFERHVVLHTDAAGRPGTTKFDHVVLALGSVTLMPPVPGLKEFGHGMKDLTDAVGLRDRMIQVLEWADSEQDAERVGRLQHMVVVGASFTGVEVAGEYLAFMRHASRRYPNLDPAACRVTVVERSDRILGALSAKLAARAKRDLEKLGVTFRLETSVREIRDDEVLLDDGTTLDSATAVWCAGIAAPSLLRSLDVPRDARGYVTCDEHLRVTDRENVWAIGDCAATLRPSGEVNPATAQQAVREGAHLARNLAAVLRGKPTRPLRPRSAGSLAALGTHRGVGVVYGLEVSGFLAWFLWRTVYLWKIPGLTRRLRVAIDWTLDLFFPKDYVQLGIHRIRGAGPPRAAPVTADTAERTASSPL
jgi:NADH dehydrogenase